MQNNNKGPSLYHVTDKNIRDAFHHKSVKFSDTLNYFLERDIFVSRNSTKSELIEYASRLPHDYFDRQFLAELLETKSRREKSTNSSLKNTTATITDLDNAYKLTKKDKDLSDDRISFTSDGNKAVITVTHTVIDHSKTELKQIDHKTFSIEVITNETSIDIRRPSNSKSNEIIEKFISNLGVIKKEDLEEEIISLEAFQEPEIRTSFFNKLIRSIEGYLFDDVRIVGVHHNTENFNEEDTDNEEDEDNEENNLSSQLVGFIKKAILDGDGVLNSPEFQQLHKSGFYISRVVWSVVKKGPPIGDKYELEAQFGNPETCTDFKYLVRNVFTLQEDNSHSQTKRSPGSLEREELSKSIEQASKNAMQYIIETHGT